MHLIDTRRLKAAGCEEPAMWHALQVVPGNSVTITHRGKVGSYWCSRSQVLFFLQTLRIQNVLQIVKTLDERGKLAFSPYFALEMPALIVAVLTKHSESDATTNPFSIPSEQTICGANTLQRCAMWQGCPIEILAHTF